MVSIQFFRLPPRVSHRTNRARLRLRIMEFELAAHLKVGGFGVGSGWFFSRGNYEKRIGDIKQHKN